MNGNQGLSASRLLTADDLADRWQIARSSVYNLTRQGKLPVVRLGKYYRYEIGAIEQFEARGGTVERKNDV